MIKNDKLMMLIADENDKYYIVVLRDGQPQPAKYPVMLICDNEVRIARTYFKQGRKMCFSTRDNLGCEKNILAQKCWFRDSFQYHVFLTFMDICETFEKIRDFHEDPLTRPAYEIYEEAKNILSLNAYDDAGVPSPDLPSQWYASKKYDSIRLTLFDVDENRHVLFARRRILESGFDEFFMLQDPLNAVYIIKSINIPDKVGEDILIKSASASFETKKVSNRTISVSPDSIDESERSILSWYANTNLNAPLVSNPNDYDIMDLANDDMFGESIEASKIN